MPIKIFFPPMKRRHLEKLHNDGLCTTKYGVVCTCVFFTVFDPPTNVISHRGQVEVRKAVLERPRFASAHAT